MVEVDEFKTTHREYKPPYTTEEKADGTKVVIIDRSKKIKPVDKEYIEMLVKAGYIPVSKRKDITKADMIKYVKDNYDQEEIDLFNKKLSTINEEENGKRVTFATIKSWFKARYVYYPKGINYNFGSNSSAKEKKERFIKVFEEHRKELKADGRTQAPMNPPTEDIHQEQPQDIYNNNKNKNNKHHN